MIRKIAARSFHPALRFQSREVERALRVLEENRAALSAGGAEAEGDLSVAFLTDQALARLHRDFLDDPSPTDVITFPGQPEFGNAGEICVSVDAASRQGALAEELLLYLVHGWLHLAGHDDLAPAKKRAMRRAEARALSLIRAARAQPRFSLAFPPPAR